MVAAANPPRPRIATTSTPRKGRYSAGMLVIIGVPVLLAVAVVWQLLAGMVHTEVAVRDAVAVSRVSLESDPVGTRIDLVLVDRVGQDTTVNGNLNIKLREPDGTVWQTVRPVGAADFGPIVDGGLLAGRMGYSVKIPASDWLRAPRHGGSATVSVNVEPAEGVPFSTVAEERFP